VTAAQSMYVDVAATRIQHYIGRTPRLKGQRGASAWLSWATSAEQVTRILRDTPELREHGAELNPEAGQADGLISVRMPGNPPSSQTAQLVAGALAAYLRSVLPSVEISGLWGAGPSYLEAYRDQMKPLRDDPPLVSLPPPAGFPPLESCAECRADPVAGQVKIHEEARRVCLDCLARYQDLYRRPGLAADLPRLPIYREEAGLARALGREPVAGTAQDFTDLAALGSQETWHNHIATVYADGNAIGALFDRIAAQGDPGLKEQASAAISAATRKSLREATRAVLGEDPGEPLPVIPHIVGGDDLVVSVVADRAWRFAVSYLDAFRTHARDIPGADDGSGVALPSASAGLVFAHMKFPFRRAAELAAGRLRAAKRQFHGTSPAVAWLDVTRDGEEPPAALRAWALEDLLGLDDALAALRAQVEPSGRAALERLVDTERPVVSLARLREHARRLDRGPVIEPFLSGLAPGPGIERMAGALSVARWWR
jgi:CRISPR RNA silencing complex Cmr2 subunit-like protein